MAAALSVELDSLSRRLDALETERANKEGRDQELVTQKAQKCTEALKSFAKLLVQWKEPLAGEDEDTDSMLAEPSVELQQAIAGIEQSLICLGDDMKRRLDENMKSSLHFSDTYASEIAGLQNKFLEAQKDVEKRIRDAQNSIGSLESSIGTASVARKGLEDNLSACEKKGADVEKSKELTDGDTAAVVVATSAGVGLWFAAIAFPPLLIGAIACNAVQAGYIADDVIKSRKIKKIKEEVEGIKSQIANSNSKIGELKSQVHSLESTRSSLQTLKAAIERTSTRSKGICEKAHSLERRYNQDQSRVAESLVRFRTVRLTLLHFEVADSRDAASKILMALSLDITAFIPHQRMVTEFLQDLTTQLNSKHIEPARNSTSMHSQQLSLPSGRLHNQLIQSGKAPLSARAIFMALVATNSIILICQTFAAAELLKWPLLLLGSGAVLTLLSRFEHNISHYSTKNGTFIVRACLIGLALVAISRISVVLGEFLVLCGALWLIVTCPMDDRAKFFAVVAWMFSFCCFVGTWISWWIFSKVFGGIFG